METKRLSQTVKTILLLAGSFTFAFLLGEMVHDSGHYLCHMAYGNAGVQVHFDPFGGTRIMGADNLPPRVLGITSAAGPLANLTLGLASFFLLRRRRHPIQLPLLLWGPIAMIQEGVTFSLGLLTPGGDAALIATLGVPKFIILVIGILSLAGGIGTLAMLLPLAGIQAADPPLLRLFIILAGMCSLMLLRASHSFLASPESSKENLIPLIFSLILALIVVWLHPPIVRKASKISLAGLPLVTWFASGFSLILGLSMFIFQAFVLH